MARGFESKSVADQQEMAQQRKRPRRAEAAAPSAVLRRRTLELARADVVHHLEMAHAEAHKEMLRRALAALDKDLAALR